LATWPAGGLSAVYCKFFTQTRVRTEVIFSLVLFKIKKYIFLTRTPLLALSLEKPRILRANIRTLNFLILSKTKPVPAAEL
jgi:hypothetical protein